MRKDAPGMADVQVGEGGSQPQTPQAPGTNLTEAEQTLMGKASTFKNIHIYLLI